MAKAKAKTWAEKMSGAKPAHVDVLEKDFGGLHKGERMLISTPFEVRDHMNLQPMGAQSTIAGMRAALAKRHDADGTCPLTASIFAQIAAEAALEDMSVRKLKPSQITPFWRVIEPDGPLAKRLSCGAEFIHLMRQTERKAKKP